MLREEWRDAVEPLLGRITAPLVDVGAGTGLWAYAFAEWFDASVVAVEPSRAMRAEAARKRSHARVGYLGGRAEQLPLRSASCAAAWLSTVVHHVDDLPRAARELRRVLIPGAPVLIRNAFTGRTAGVPWLRFFPAARPLAERRWPTIDAVLGAFGPAGFHLEEVREVAEVTAENLTAYAKLLRTRADSTLAELDDDEFKRGMRAVEHASAAHPDTPVITRLDLLLLR